MKKFKKLFDGILTEDQFDSVKYPYGHTLTINPNIINHLFEKNLISEEDYKKYMLSEDPTYIPPLKNSTS